MGFFWRPYVPVAQRRAQAMRKIEKLKKKGVVIQPIEIVGKKIAASFWGKAWCDHLESFSDYDNRLPRGRTYVRNGSVCHLEIKKGRIEAIVSGSDLYNVAIDIKPLKPAMWKTIKRFCSGKIGSMLELLRGQLSDHVMSIVTDRQKGLMPLPGEIKLACSCPDWANMCKHVAAVLYGVGSRLDSQPELLFTLRGVDPAELISGRIALPTSGTAAAGKVIAQEQISDIFGIEINPDDAVEITPKKPHAKTQSLGPQETRHQATKTVKAKKKVKKGIPETASRKTKKTDDLPHLVPTGAFILKLRTQLGLSVSQFAERLGVTPTTIKNWEKKRGRLNLYRHSLSAVTRLHQECASEKK